MYNYEAGVCHVSFRSRWVGSAHSLQNSSPAGWLGSGTRGHDRHCLCENHFLLLTFQQPPPSQYMYMASWWCSAVLQSFPHSLSFSLSELKFAAAAVSALNCQKKPKNNCVWQALEYVREYFVFSWVGSGCTCEARGWILFVESQKCYLHLYAGQPEFSVISEKSTSLDASQHSWWVGRRTPMNTQVWKQAKVLQRHLIKVIVWVFKKK